MAESKVDEAEVYYVSGTGISAELKQNDIAIGSQGIDSGIVIRIIKNGKIGVSSTDNPENWEPCLNAAISSSQFSDPLDWTGLPKPVKLNQNPLSFDESVTIEPEKLTELVDRMKNGAKAYPDAHITSGSVSLGRVKEIIANTNDLWYETSETSVHLGVEMISDKSTGSDSDGSWSLSKINPEDIGKTAAFFANKGKSGEEIKTGTYDIILSPMAVCEILDATVLPALSGRNVHTGRSYFVDKMDKTVISPAFTISDNPIDERGISNCLWDGEGSPAQKIDFIKSGVLKSFAYDIRTACRYGKNSTGNATRTGQNGAPGIGFHNLSINGPTRDIMKDDSLYIRSLIGAHTANPMSGDFSVELSNPFIIEGGELNKPVKTGMLSGNIFDMLMKADGCSKETKTYGSLIMPSISIKNASIVGRG